MSAFAFEVHYATEWNRQAGRCGVAVFVTPAGVNNVLVITELADNPGPSVTNAIEAICRRLEQILDCPRLEDFTIIEHYPADGQRAGTWDVVTLDHDGRSFHNPRWRHVTADAVDAMIPVASPDYRLADVVRCFDPTLESLAGRRAGAR